MYRCPHCKKLIKEAQLTALRGAELLTEEERERFLSIWKELFSDKPKMVSEVLTEPALRGFLAPQIGSLSTHAQSIEVGRILSDLLGLSYGGLQLLCSGYPKHYKLINPTNKLGGL